MRLGWYVATLILMVVGSLVAGCESETDPEETEAAASAVVEEESPVLAAGAIPPGVNEEEVEQGRELFLPCAVCHGLDGRGNQLGPSLRDGEWIRIGGSLQEIERVIREGVPQPERYPVPMVPMGGGDFEVGVVRAVAAYVFAISRAGGVEGEPASAPPTPPTTP